MYTSSEYFIMKIIIVGAINVRGFVRCNIFADKKIPRNVSTAKSADLKRAKYRNTVCHTNIQICHKYIQICHTCTCTFKYVRIY
jgi:hypothetical protein